MWECGLKQPNKRQKPEVRKVTPYVGVWIETAEQTSKTRSSQSLLMWECGLKQELALMIRSTIWSLLMWECGLKH